MLLLLFLSSSKAEIIGQSNKLNEIGESCLLAAKTTSGRNRRQYEKKRRKEEKKDHKGKMGTNKNNTKNRIDEFSSFVGSRNNENKTIYI